MHIQFHQQSRKSLNALSYHMDGWLHVHEVWMDSYVGGTSWRELMLLRRRYYQRGWCAMFI